MRYGIFVVVLMSTFMGLSIDSALAGQGCCSSHGGVASCSGSRLACNDGTPSPTCRCSNAGKHYRLKDDSVKADEPHPKIANALDSVTDVWDDHHLPEPVVTSGNDNKHPGRDQPGTQCGSSNSEAECRATSNSLHYKNKAIDLRDHDMDPQTKGAVIEDLQKKLGKQYRVGLHKKGTKDEHIHIEYHGD